MCIDNADKSLYQAGWGGYLPYVLKGQVWTRVHSSSYVDGEFRFRVGQPGSRVTVAWYEPYGVDQMHRFIQDRLQGRSDAIAEINDNGFAVIRIGDATLPRITVIARQHPGETIGSFFVEGFVDQAFLDVNKLDLLLRQYSLLIVPIVNIDGVRQHRHRYDKQGRDCNRSWTATNPPDGVLAVKQILRAVEHHAVFVDVHGDEVSKTSYVSFRVPRRLNEGLGSRYSSLLAGIRSAEYKTLVWQAPSYLKRTVKRLIRKRRINLREGTTANQYMVRKGKCLSLTYELGASILTPAEARLEGARFMKNLAESFLEPINRP